MRIKEITKQIRRDFWAVYECEHCDHSYKGIGYDDDNFHVNVIPKMKCSECNKSASDNYRPLTTKYDASEIV